MSTRAQIIVTDGEDAQWFYRHCDGYPDGTMPTLKKFMGWVKEGKIRDNVLQAAGWLVILGHIERCQDLKQNFGEPEDWEVGSYEPCPYKKQHGDIEYLYTVNLKTKRITCKKI